MSDPEQDRAALKAVTREAHELLKDLRATMRDAQALLSAIGEAAQADVDALVKPVIEEEIANMGEQTKKAMDAAVERVFDQFDNLADTLLGNDRASRRKHGASIPEMAEKKAREREAEGEPPGPI